MVWCGTVWCVCWVRTRSGLRIRCRWAMDTATKHRIFNPVFQKESRRPTAKKRLSLYFWATPFKNPRNVRKKKLETSPFPWKRLSLRLRIANMAKVMKFWLFLESQYYLRRKYEGMGLEIWVRNSTALFGSFSHCKEINITQSER